MMSGLGSIDGDTWELCVTPLKKDQVVDKNG